MQEKKAVMCKKISGPVKDFSVKPPVPFPEESKLALMRFWDKENCLPREKGFAWTGYCEEGLRFAAFLEDSEIITKVTSDNQKIWMLGDTVEFFIKPGQRQTVYYEIHISPNGHIMDLRIPSREKFRNKEISWEQVLNFNSHSRYKTFILPGAWAVEITIPWSCFGLQKFSLPQTNWQFAVCRYNYSSAWPEPELSSTAHFTRADFHRYEDYHELVFV